MLRKLLAGATTLLVATGLSLIAVAAPASAAGTNPLSSLDDFTVLTEGDATTTGSASETEGSWAVGGALTVNKSYVIGGTHGATLPVLDGKSTQLLVNGKIVFGSVSGEALDVNSGVTRVGDTAGYAVTEGKKFHTSADASTFHRMYSDATIDQVGASGLYGSTFPTAFSDLRSRSSAIASYGSGAVNLVTLHQPSTVGGSGDADVTLVSGTVNLLRVSSASLSSIPNIWFKTVQPSSTTPFIIDVTDTGTVSLSAPVVRNVDQSSVLWNFAGATTLNLNGQGGNGYVEGSILAPNAQLNFQSGYVEGQIAAKSLVVSSNGEIHHYGFIGNLPQSAAGSYSYTGPCAAVSNSLTVDKVTGINYTWTTVPVDSGLSGSFDHFSATGLPPGTYTFSIAATSGYSLSGSDQGNHTFVSTDTCPKPQDATGHFSFVTPTCSVTTGGYTLEAASNASYTVAVGGTTTTGIRPVSTTTVGDLPVGTVITITVVPDSDHDLAVGVTESGSQTLAADADCTTPLHLHLDPKASPETCVAGSTTGATDDGTITIPHIDHVSFTITPQPNGVAVPVDTTAPGDHVFPYSHGTYLVTAVLDANYTTTDDLTAPVTVGAPALPCSLDTHAALPTEVDHTDAVCQTDGSSAGTITVGPSDSLPFVNYFIDGKAVTAATTTLPAGTYQVTATVNQTTAPG